jgi:hypothetical protein
MSTILAQQPLAPGFPVPLEIHALSDPQLLTVDASNVVVYELVIANPTREAISILELEVRGTTGGYTNSFDGMQLRELAQRIPPVLDPAQLGHEEGMLTLTPGERFMIYLWIELPEGVAVPAGMAHRFVVVGNPHPLVLTGPTLELDLESIVIDPPVRGGRWLVDSGLANDTDHRRWYSVVGGLHIPQKFGADFLKLDADGRNAANDSLSLKSFYAYGEPLYAVADGTAVAVRDGLPDQQVGGRRKGIDWNTVAGNHVFLEIGPERYALYAHLAAGSIEVSPGDRVRRGDRIGRIGNSGNSKTPHLHFHIQRSPQLNEASGAPFLFRTYELLQQDYRFQPEQRPLADEGVIREDSLPAYRQVVRFPRRSRS